MVTEENKILKTREFVMEFGGLGFFCKMKKVFKNFFLVSGKNIYQPIKLHSGRNDTCWKTKTYSGRWGLTLKNNGFFSALFCK